MSRLFNPTRSPWIATPLIAFASFMGLYGFSTMIQIGGWVRTVISLLVVVSAAVIATRIVTRSRALPTIVGAATAILLLIPVYVRSPEGDRRLLPTPSAFTDLAATLQDGVTHAATAIAPAEATRPFTALIAAALIGLFLVAEHLAISWRAVASAGLLLLVPWLPAVFFQHRASTAALLLAVAAWLAAMALTRRTPASERMPSIGAAATATTAAILAAVLVVPTALGGQGWGMIPRFEAPQTFDTATRLNLALDLRNSLTTNSQSPVLTYVTAGDKPDTLRLYTLTEFDGTAWTQAEPVITNRLANSGVLWPEQVTNWNERDRQRIDIQVESLAERNLPLPSAPRTVDVAAGWFYNPDLDEVITDGAGTQNLRYSVVTDLNYHDADDLRGSQQEIVAGVGDITDARYLTIAPAIDLERVRTLATTVTSQATTRYEQGVALQQYLRSPSEFQYDTSVSPTGADSVSSFLDDRSGYCVQFSTTMVVMARSLGIPARLAVGFLAGSYAGDDTYTVRGGDAHAWPELYFPGHGWVRFEPTPAVQTGVPPEWADPFANQVPVPAAILEGGQNTPPQLIPQVPQTPITPGPAADAAPTVPAWVFGIAIALVVAAAAALWWWRRQRASEAHAHEGPEGAWITLRERLGDEFAWPEALTPHEVAEHVETRMRNLGPGLTASASEAMRALANAVSDHRYAWEGTAASQEQMLTWVESVATQAREALAAELATR